MKTSYIAPPSGNLDITVVRDKEPYCTLSLDLGIPKFTVFTLKMPIAVDDPKGMEMLLAEALSALLDEMSAFMISLNFKQEVIVQIYATVLATFQEMTPDSTTDAGMSEVGNDNTVITYEGSFPLPMPFVNETYDKVVTGSSVLKRMPKQRSIELTVMKPNKIETRDVQKIIQQYRGRSLKNQPKSMYVIVYDQRGRPSGTLSLGPQFKNNLLKKVNSSKEACHPDNDIGKPGEPGTIGAGFYTTRPLGTKSPKSEFELTTHPDHGKQVLLHKPTGIYYSVEPRNGKLDPDPWQPKFRAKDPFAKFTRQASDVEIPCDTCDGTGWQPDSPIEIECNECDGTGFKQDV